ncbi:MAG: hypothetical protein K0R08_1629, partial [Solimicrobium sp.]|nr:hypothetical protein [Solimicrobium sp.]
MNGASYRICTFNLQRLNHNKSTGKDSSQNEINKAVRLYQELSAGSLAKSCQFMGIVLSIQRSVHASQRKEEIGSFAKEQLSDLFSNTGNASEIEELALLLLNLATTTASINYVSYELPVTREIDALLEQVKKWIKEARELEKQERQSQSIFELPLKDVDSKILNYLDNSSLLAMRLVSKVASVRASEKLKSTFIDFEKICSSNLSLFHLCELYENLTLPFISVKVNVRKDKLTLFTQFMKSLSKNSNIKSIELCMAYSHLGDSGAFVVSTVSNIINLNISGNGITQV